MFRKWSMYIDIDYDILGRMGSEKSVACMEGFFLAIGMYSLFFEE